MTQLTDDKRHRGMAADWTDLTNLSIGTMLVGALILPRFATYVGHSELSLSLLLTLIPVAAMVLIGRLSVNVSRLILFCTAMAAITLSVALGSTGQVSATSFMLLIVLYATYTFQLPDEPGRFERTIRMFRAIASFVAIAGILQFFAQLVIPGPTLFTFESFLPPKIVSHGFNYVIPVPNLPMLNKSNGFFLLEPSSFSQLMGLSIIVEVMLFRSAWRLLTFSIGLLLSFSGTGLILLLAFVPALLIRQGRLRLVLLLLVLGACGLVVVSVLHLTSFLDRIGEFGSNRSSAFARFLSPFYLMDDFIFPHIRTTLFGLGPGSIDPYFEATDYQVHDPTWGKLFFEYGLVGFVFFMIFLINCFLGNVPSLWLGGALFVQYLLLGGNLLDARIQPLVLTLLLFPGGASLLARERADVPAIDKPFGRTGQGLMVPLE